MKNEYEMIYILSILLIYLFIYVTIPGFNVRIKQNVYFHNTHFEL